MGRIYLGWELLNNRCVYEYRWHIKSKLRLMRLTSTYINLRRNDLSIPFISQFMWNIYVDACSIQYSYNTWSEFFLVFFSCHVVLYKIFIWNQFFHSSFFFLTFFDKRIFRMIVFCASQVIKMYFMFLMRNILVTFPLHIIFKLLSIKITTSIRHYRILCVESLTVFTFPINQ